MCRLLQDGEVTAVLAGPAGSTIDVAPPVLEESGAPDAEPGSAKGVPDNGSPRPTNKNGDDKWTADNTVTGCNDLNRLAGEAWTASDKRKVLLSDTPEGLRRRLN
jgi:hypothetical protein